MSGHPAAPSPNGHPGRRRALVAGAAGFIGSHLVARLLGEGWDVVGIDNFLTGDRSNLERFADHPRFTFHEHDVVEPLEEPGRLDWLLHFASPASPPRYLAHPIHTLRSNAEGTFQLLQLARRKRAAFLLASTSEVYGDSHEHPQRESYWGHVNPVGPRSVYDEGKRYAEAMALAYHRAHEVPVRVIRIFNTYGPRMRVDDGRVVVNFILQALTGRPLTIYGDGSQTRSFQYVDDLVEGVRRMMQGACTGPVNLGNPVEHSVLELARMVRRLTGAAVPIVHGPLPVDDPRLRRPDITLASRLLGWAPRVPVEEGLRRTIAWFRQVLAAGGDPRAASDVDGVDAAGPIEVARLAHAGGRDRNAWRSPAP
jgi:dTDP-glucose 4,6-dehydratase